MRKHISQVSLKALKLLLHILLFQQCLSFTIFTWQGKSKSILGKEINEQVSSQILNQRLLSFDLDAHGILEQYNVDDSVKDHYLHQQQEKSDMNYSKLQSSAQINPANTNLQRNPSRQAFLTASSPYSKWDPKETQRLSFNRPFTPIQPLSPPIQSTNAQIYQGQPIGTEETNQIGRNTIESSYAGLMQNNKASEWRIITNKDFDKIDQKTLEEFNHYQSRYKISRFDQLPFCVVVPTFNNKVDERYLRNIRSIIMQNYTNYHVVVFDDASTDGTGELIAQTLEKQTKLPKKQYQIIKNTEQKKTMFNLRRAAMEFCQPKQIFLVVDGDDQLIGRQILKLYSAYFQREDAWFVYSNFLHGFFNELGYSMPFGKQIKQQNKYRVQPFVTSHLRAFYTILFRNIDQKDLRDDQGEYFRAANDVAICMPILEQSHTHVSFLPQLTYYYNDNTGQNNHLIRASEQKNNDIIIRNKMPYEPLKSLFGKK